VQLGFLLALGALTVASAALAWFALGRSPPPLPLDVPERRPWQVLAARHGLRELLQGPPASWRLEGEIEGVPVAVRVIEIDDERWTEVRVRLSGPAPALDAHSKVEAGWLLRTIEGAEGEAVAALVEESVAMARGEAGPAGSV